MVLHFALELGQNFDKRFSPDLPNLKTLLVKEKSCFALYTSIRSPLARRSASVVSPTFVKVPMQNVIPLKEIV